MFPCPEASNSASHQSFSVSGKHGWVALGWRALSAAARLKLELNEKIQSLPFTEQSILLHLQRQGEQCRRMR